MVPDNLLSIFDEFELEVSSLVNIYVLLYTKFCFRYL